MMTIEEKAKRYDEVLEKATSLMKGEHETTYVYSESLFDYLFPELKESEDERIRKALLIHLKNELKRHGNLGLDYGIITTDAIAWLEKQGEQKISTWGEDDEKYSSYICAALQCYYRLREDRNNTNGQEDLEKARNWLYNRLKSLRPQSTWIPSKEHLEALEFCLEHNIDKDGVFGSKVVKLYNELKDL